MFLSDIIRKVTIVCEQHNKPIKIICISNSSLLVKLEDNSNFTLYYRDMTEKDIESVTSTCCKLSSDI